MAITTDQKTRDTVGYGISNSITTSVLAGGDVSGEMDFGRPYFVFVIRILDCQYISAATDMTMLTATYPGTMMCSVYETNDPSIEWSKGALPTTEVSLSVLITHAFGARYMQLAFSVVTGAGATPIEVIALDPAVGDVPFR